MQNALHDAGISPHRIQYVNAHGPSDKHMDRVETDAIRKIFQSHASQLMVSSIKGMTGNPFAAGGGMQMVASALAMKECLIPPTTNYEFPDPDCPLDFVPRQARRVAVEKVLVNSHGIGGGNCTVALGRFKE
jgi:3-oxoacyl-[acyl-carrier-protein] synthase II